MGEGLPLSRPGGGWLAKNSERDMGGKPGGHDVTEARGRMFQEREWLPMSNTAVKSQNIGLDQW